MNLPNMERAGVAWREYSFLENENVARHNPAILSTSGRVYLDLDVGDPNRPEAGEVADVFTSAAGGKENAAAVKKEKGVRTENVAATRASAGRTVTLPAFPSDAELARAVGDANEGLLIVSSGIASFCGFENPETARAFDEQMRRRAGSGVALLRRRRRRRRALVRHRIRHSQRRRGGPRLRVHARERARPGGVQAEVREDRQAPGLALRGRTPFRNYLSLRRR